MNKFIHLLVVGVVVLGITAPAIAEFSELQLIRVVYHLNGSLEVAANLGTVEDLIAQSNATVGGGNSAFSPAQFPGAEWSDLYVAYFAVDSAEQDAWTSGPEGNQTSGSRQFTTFKSASSSIFGYYNTLDGSGAVTAQQSWSNSYWAAMDSWGLTRGGFTSLIPAMNGERNLADLDEVNGGPGYVDQFLYFYDKPNSIASGVAVATLRTTAEGTTIINPETVTTYALSGTVTSGGAALAGVTVNLTGATTQSTTTDSNGNYSFSGLSNGAYTITPAKNGYSFTPPSIGLTISGADATGQNFAATAITYALSGTVTSGGVALAGVTVNLTGATTQSTTTDDNGNYSFSGLSNGAYTITPGKAGYSFTPPSIGLTISGADATGKNFAASLPQMNLMVLDAKATEGTPVTDKARLRITRTGDISEPLVVKLSFSGTAKNKTDYKKLPLKVTIPANAEKKDLFVVPLDDEAVEGTETLTLTILPDAAYELSSSVSGTVEIDDDEPDLPVVNLKLSDADATEGTPVTDKGKLQVTRTGDLSEPLIVKIKVTGSTATAKTDYKKLSSSVTIPAGKAAKVILVTPVDDSTKEALETVIVSLVESTAYALGTSVQKTVKIYDND